MEKPVIQLRNIVRNFPLGSQTVYVLKDIDLDIMEGEYVALMGPSGSGKSTLMNLLGCLDTPTSGSYNLANHDVSDMTDDQLADIRNREIGFVFQTFNLIPRQTALQNVALPLVYAGIGKADRLQRAAEVLADVGLDDRMDHQPNQLSGGQRQRVAIARALVNKPSMILADEPTGNLDPELSLDIMRLFKRFNDIGVTMVIATHDLNLLNQLGGKRLVLKDGEIDEHTLPEFKR